MEPITEKKTRTPRNAESIESGALKLSLEERVELCKKLKDSITTEVSELANKSEAAKNMIDGL